MAGAGIWVTTGLRWLLFTGLAAALGGIAARALASRHAGPAPAHTSLPGPWALRASLLGLLASAGLAIQAHHGLLHTTAGVADVVELISFALAAVLLRLRHPGLATLPLCVVIGAEGFRAHPERVIPVGGALLTWAHLTPAALWAGMLGYVVRAAVAWRQDPAAVRRLVGLYSRAAGWLFGAVVVTGITSALVLMPADRLLSTGYGRVLIIKAALVAVAAGLALHGRRRLRRDPAPAAGTALSTRLEVATLVVVLAVTALLTALSPPRTGSLIPASSGRPASARPAPARPAPARPAPARPAPAQPAPAQPRTAQPGTARP
jgi:copper transport protein